MFEIELNTDICKSLKFTECADTLAKILGIRNQLIVEVNFVSKAEMKELNKKLRGINNETDVISVEFSYEKELNIPQLIGEIYFSKQYIEDQAYRLNHTYEREINFVFVHGLLHLLGYDHCTKKDEDIMFGIQEEVLKINEINR